MKKFLYIFSIFFTTFCFSQNPIINILNENGSAKTNAYYKDVDNILNPFTGTYIYTNGNNQLKIQLIKMTLQFNGRYYEDLLIGEYQYIENGVEIINTLGNINENYINQHKHNIVGNIIIDNPNFRMWKCPTCDINEKRVMITISDDLSKRFGYLILRKVVEVDSSGQTVETLHANITNVSRSFSDNPNPPDFHLPIGEFTMIKQ